jgi:hypothetical protein
VHDGRFLLGVGEDPVLAEGDHLLIALPAVSRGRGEVSRARQSL